MFCLVCLQHHKDQLEVVIWVKDHLKTDFHGASNTNVLHNNLRVRLSPIKSPVLRIYLNPFKRFSMYPSISKCNAKSCNCCQHVCTNTAITSSVNGRTFLVINNSDLD